MILRPQLAAWKVFDYITSCTYKRELLVGVERTEQSIDTVLLAVPLRMYPG